MADLKKVVQGKHPRKVVKLKQICRKACSKIPPQRFANLIYLLTFSASTVDVYLMCLIKDMNSTTVCVLLV